MSYQRAVRGRGADLSGDCRTNPVQFGSMIFYKVMKAKVRRMRFDKRFDKKYSGIQKGFHIDPHICLTGGGDGGYHSAFDGAAD